METIQGSCLARTQDKMCLLTLYFKPFRLWAKAFFMYIISELRCGREETVDIDILLTSRIDDRKRWQLIRTTSGPTTRTTKLNQFSQVK